HFGLHPLDAQALVAERSGIAPVTFTNLGAVLLYTPHIGGSDVTVTGLPAQTNIGMVVGADVVTLGKTSCQSVDAPPSTLADIKADISVQAFSLDDVVSLIVDDSGNTDPTPRTIEITPATGDYAPGTHLVGLTPASIYWNLGATSSVSIRGVAADETF